MVQINGRSHDILTFHMEPDASTVTRFKRIAPSDSTSGSRLLESDSSVRTTIMSSHLKADRKLELQHG